MRATFLGGYHVWHDARETEAIAGLQDMGLMVQPKQPPIILPHDVALQNAPESDGTFFKVPKVIDK